MQRTTSSSSLQNRRRWSRLSETCDCFCSFLKLVFCPDTCLPYLSRRGRWAHRLVYWSITLALLGILGLACYYSVTTPLHVEFVERVVAASNCTVLNLGNYYTPDGTPYPAEFPADLFYVYPNPNTYLPYRCWEYNETLSVEPSRPVIVALGYQETDVEFSHRPPPVIHPPQWMYQRNFPAKTHLPKMKWLEMVETRPEKESITHTTVQLSAVLVPIGSVLLCILLWIVCLTCISIWFDNSSW